MPKDVWLRFLKCRNRLWALIAKQDLEFSKSDEGLIELVTTYPDYFTSPSSEAPPEGYAIVVHSYLLCDSGRRETFSGATFERTLDGFEKWLSRKEGLSC